MNNLNYEYDKNDLNDILKHAKSLIGHCVGDIYKLEENGNKNEFLLKYYEQINFSIEEFTENGIKEDKGIIGNLVQEIYFNIPKNSSPIFDIEESHVELKTSPLKKNSKGIVVKERLDLGNISKYVNEENDKLAENFEDSSIYKKCKLMLIIYYLDEKNNQKRKSEFLFKKAFYFTIPECDMNIIKKDYNYIRDLVNNKKYDDLHESNTMYLSPSCKNGKRAFSLKCSYMNYILKEYVNRNKNLYDSKKTVSSSNEYYDSIFKNINQEKEYDTYLEDLVKPYIGKSLKEIRRLTMTDNEYNEWLNEKQNDKADYARTTYLMMKIKTKDAREFMKAGITVKTFRVEKKKNHYTINEKISFPSFEFNDFVKEEWEESECYYDMICHKFLFSIFIKENDEYVFKGIKLWKVPYEDIKTIKIGWLDIQDIVKNGVKFYIKKSKSKTVILNNFPDSLNTKASTSKYKYCKCDKKYNEIISIRPHTSRSYYVIKNPSYTFGINPSNGSVLPNGDIMTKQCFWFNNSYILKQIKDLL